MSSTDNGLYEFDVYRIKIESPLEKSQLLRSDEPVVLTEMETKLLCVLVEESIKSDCKVAAPIENLDLIKKVWDGYAADERSLHQLVTRLRKKMSDVEGKYINNVRGRGYRLGIPITPKINEAIECPPDTTQKPTKAARHAMPLLQVIWSKRIVIALLFLFGIALVIFFLLRRPFLVPYDPCSRSVEMIPTPLTQIEVATVDEVDEMVRVKRQVDPQEAYHVESLCNGVPLVMVKIPVKIDPGKSWMGSRENEPMRDSEGDEVHHLVNIEYIFYIGQYEVTRAQWWAVASRTDLKEELDLALDPSHFKGDDELPVEGINWYEAVEFCKRLTKMTGNLYRLPSETEWEYACRAHTQTPFSFGNTIMPDWANYDWRSSYNQGVKKDESLNRTKKVGTSGLANGFGLYDMHGNVWEFCQDWTNNKQRKDDYNFTPNNGCPREKRAGDNQVIIRGGSWNKPPEQSRSADRGYDKPDDVRSWGTGFRVVMDGVLPNSKLRGQCR